MMPKKNRPRSQQLNLHTASYKEGVDTIYFTSHMDTVVPGNGIKPSIEDGYIKSDGTTILGADDKAGLAAMLEAITVLKEEKSRTAKLNLLLQ